MQEYILMLAVSYFKEKGNKYIIGELAELLGYNNYQIDELITELITREYIGYSEGLIKITAKGVSFLIQNNQGDMNLVDDDYKTIHIKPEEAMPIDEPYVPKKFMEKYDG